MKEETPDKEEILKQLRECLNQRERDREERAEEARGALERCEEKQEQLRDKIEQERDSFREKIDSSVASRKTEIEKLRKRLTFLTVGGSAAAAVVGKDIVEKISENLSILDAIFSGDVQGVIDATTGSPGSMSGDNSSQSDQSGDENSQKASDKESSEEEKPEEEEEEEKPEEEEEEQEEEEEEEEEQEEASPETQTESVGLPINPDLDSEGLVFPIFTAEVDEVKIPDTPLVLAPLPSPFVPKVGLAAPGDFFIPQGPITPPVIQEASIIPSVGFFHLLLVLLIIQSVFDNRKRFS